MDKFNRAVRRHHIERLKANRKHYWSKVNTVKALGKIVQYPAACSCWMCGNPRRRHNGYHWHNGILTVQEQRQQEQADYEILTWRDCLCDLFH